MCQDYLMQPIPYSKKNISNLKIQKTIFNISIDHANHHQILQPILVFLLRSMHNRYGGILRPLIRFNHRQFRIQQLNTIFEFQYLHPLAICYDVCANIRAMVVCCIWLLLEISTLLHTHCHLFHPAACDHHTRHGNID